MKIPCSILAAALLLLGVAARAQDPATQLGGAKSAEETPAEEGDLEAQIEQLAARAAEWEVKAAEYEQLAMQAPSLLAKIDAEIAALREPVEAVAAENQPIDQLEVLVLGAEQDLALAQREAAELEEEFDGRSERRRQLPELLANAKLRLEELELRPVAAERGASPELQQRLAELRRKVLENEVLSHEQELLSYEARGELLLKRIARANLRGVRAERRLDALRKIVKQRREGEAERAAQRALESLQEVSSLSPALREVVRQLAQENAELASSRTGEQGLVQAIDVVSRKLATADRRLSEVEADHQRLSRRVESGGLTGSVGLQLRKTRSRVPDVGKYRRFIRMRQEEIGSVQGRQLELRDELVKLAKVDAIVADALEHLGPETRKGDRMRLEALLRDLLETKRRHLIALLGDYEIYFQKLVDFDARQQELIAKTEELLLFIDQRILWFPSSGAVQVAIASDGLDALRWLATPRHWKQLAHAVVAVFTDAPILSFGAALLLLGSIPLGRRVRPRLRELARQARQPTCIDAWPTFEALGLSLALAPWGPAALAYLGWRLGVSPDATQFVRSLAHGLLSAGAVWLTLEVPRQLLQRDGIADAHFDWPADAVRSLRREIGWITAAAVPLVFLIQMLEMRGEESWRESLGRVCLIVLMGAMAVVTHRLLRATGPLRIILGGLQGAHLAPWVWRVLHVAGVGTPLALAAAAGRGYFWTALRLSASYHLTLVFLFLLLIVFQLSLRWSLLVRRRLAFQKWNEAREEEESSRKQLEVSGERTEIAEVELDLGTVHVQTGRLLATSTVVAMVLGLWFIWADLLPAAGILDSVELWSTTQSQTIETTAADGSRHLQTEEREVPITLADLLFGLILVFMTLVLVRNLSGLLEISVFRWLGTGSGERYAIASITKYAILLAGGLLVFNAVGVSWSKLQWLVAGVGLGLGFGLQEIFANFVSGLIILFERPIRVGDTVTVGDMSGTVSKIRIRATWITAFDRKELVVPNKDIITNRLVNWSLSDRVLRAEVRVGIASGADLERAIQELLSIGAANEYALKDPKPEVICFGFGESGLTLELRVFSPDVEHRLLIVHQLHLAISRAFREAGIELASPQLDVDIRSLPQPASGSS